MHGNFIKHCEGNELEGVNYCLSRGFDVNSKYNGMTGLMFACESGNSAIVSRLVQVPGLDINYHYESFGYTAACLACASGRSRKNPHFWAWLYSNHQETECMRILANTGKVDWNKADSWGRTPLYWALGNFLTFFFIVCLPVRSNFYQ